jgi:hypothetical protein
MRHRSVLFLLFDCMPLVLLLDIRACCRSCSRHSHFFIHAPCVAPYQQPTEIGRGEKILLEGILSGSSTIFCIWMGVLLEVLQCPPIADFGMCRTMGGMLETT